MVLTYLVMAALCAVVVGIQHPPSDERFMVTIDDSPRYLPGPTTHLSSSYVAVVEFCETYGLTMEECEAIDHQYRPWFDEREGPLIDGCRARFGFRGQGGYGEMSDEQVDTRCAELGVLGGCEDLGRFTGLTPSELRERIRRAGTHHFEGEHLFRNPKSATELAWFYATSTTYIFANVLHPYPEPLARLGVEDGPVFEFSGGVGNSVIHLASRGVRSAYYGIGELEFQVRGGRGFVRGEGLCGARFLVHTGGAACCLWGGGSRVGASFFLPATGDTT